MRIPTHSIAGHVGFTIARETPKLQFYNMQGKNRETGKQNMSPSQLSKITSHEATTFRVLTAVTERGWEDVSLCRHW